MSMISQLDNPVIQHAYREQNFVADSLAKYAERQQHGSSVEIFEYACIVESSSVNPPQAMGSGPISNPIQNPTPNPSTDPKSISFDQVSKLFNLPLSYAAESLGVCASVLKKICYENGLVRWPYRKVISGKSIEDIKEASREKQERSVEFPKAAGEKHDSFASSAISSFPGSPLQNKSISSTMEMPKAGAFSQQQGTRIFQSGSLPHFRVSNLTRGTSVSYDEFKYGFPSDGLSTVTYRWWGNKSPDNNEDSQLNDDNAKNSKEQAENVAEKLNARQVWIPRKRVHWQM